MKTIFNIIKEINEITLKIEFQYPELYRNLNEMPIKFPKNESSEVEVRALKEYLVNLKELVRRYESSH